jgi:hypothetical protein
MYINLNNLEAIRELPNQGEIMLTSNQIRRLQTTECWLREIQNSEEFRQLNYYPDITIGDAIQAVVELLDEQKLYDYKLSNFTDESLTLMCVDGDKKDD